MRCIRGVPRRDFRAWAICRACVHPTSFLSTFLQNGLFEGYLFSFGGNPGFVVFPVVIVVVLNFFSQNQILRFWIVSIHASL